MELSRTFRRCGSRRFLSCLVLGSLIPFATTNGQDIVPLDQGAVGLHQALQQLQTTVSVLHVVAHPDDEDGALLAYCARGLGARTMLFSITRGEGGANLISADFFDRLGLLRTLEHRKAADIYGNQLFYSRAADYGFSKTLREAQRQWDEGEPILADLVEVIRRERPTILLSRFRGDSRDGHGHHQLAGVLSQAAVDAAADPARFPEQISRGLRPWKVAKFYTNNIRPQWREEDRDAWTLAIPTGEFHPLLGRSFAQVARYGLGYQRSQGMSGHHSPAGQQVSYYRKVTGNSDDPPARESHLLEDIDKSLIGLVPADVATSQDVLRFVLQSIDEQIGTAASAFDARRLESVLPALTAGLNQTRSVLSQLSGLEVADRTRSVLNDQLQRKVELFERAIVCALGLECEAWAEPSEEQSTASLRHVVPGQTFAVQLRITQRSGAAVTLQSIELERPSDWKIDWLVNPAGEGESNAPAVELSSEGHFANPLPLANNVPWQSTCRVVVPETAAPTRPYWQRDSIRETIYKTPRGNGEQGDLPSSPFQVLATLTCGDTTFHVRRELLVRYRHPEYGNVQYPLAVLPTLSVRFLRPYGVLPTDQLQYSLDVLLTNASIQPVSGEVRLELPAGWRSDPDVAEFTMQRDGDEVRQAFVLHVPDDADQSRIDLEAVAEVDGRSYREGYVTVSARDVGRTHWFSPARHRLTRLNVQVAGQPRVGYITGSGDDVAQSLALLGIAPETLGSDQLATADLSSFDIIMVGVRAYAVREDIRAYNTRLLDYVAAGGVLIVQYQTPEFDHNYGPYPYSMGRSPEEVSEEDAAVRLLQPEHVVMRRPNRITEQDFADWVEQRGSKFWATWDDRYVPLLECHDADQPPQQGGLLVARHGQGVYVYAAYAWYRQLPHGVPGAYRLMANLLSLPVTKDE